MNPGGQDLSSEDRVQLEAIATFLEEKFPEHVGVSIDVAAIGIFRRCIEAERDRAVIAEHNVTLVDERNAIELHLDAVYRAHCPNEQGAKLSTREMIKRLDAHCGWMKQRLQEIRESVARLRQAFTTELLAPVLEERSAHRAAAASPPRTGPHAAPNWAGVVPIPQGPGHPFPLDPAREPLGFRGATVEPATPESRAAAASALPPSEVGRPRVVERVPASGVKSFTVERPERPADASAPEPSGRPGVGLSSPAGAVRTRIERRVVGGVQGFANALNRGDGPMPKVEDAVARGLEDPERATRGAESSGG